MLAFGDALLCLMLPAAACRETARSGRARWGWRLLAASCGGWTIACALLLPLTGMGMGELVWTVPAFGIGIALAMFVIHVLTTALFDRLSSRGPRPS